MSSSMPATLSLPSHWCAPWRRSITSSPPARLLVLLPREPFPLYRALEINGFSWQTSAGRRHGGSPDPASSGSNAGTAELRPGTADLRALPLFSDGAAVCPARRPAPAGSGPELLASRWTPAALALTHLITVGFMLQVMLGAMIQILPVVAGANIARPLRVATLVHALLVRGALLLVAGFLSFPSRCPSAGCRLLGLASRSSSAPGRAYGACLDATRPFGLKLASSVDDHRGLGICWPLALGGSLALPLLQLTTDPLRLGFRRLEHHPAGCRRFGRRTDVPDDATLPDWFTRRFSSGRCSLVVAVEHRRFPRVAAAGVMSWRVHAVAARRLRGADPAPAKRHSKRARFDATQHYWRWRCSAAGRQHPVASPCSCRKRLPARQLPLLCGVLVLFGSFMSVMIWHALQDRSLSGLAAPAECSVAVASWHRT
jgi:hypothetical protein